MTRKSVMDKIRREIEVHSIKILGDRQDRSDAFYILMNTQSISSDNLDIYHGVRNSTIELLKDAEIKFEILKGGQTTK